MSSSLQEFVAPIRANRSTPAPHGARPLGNQRALSKWIRWFTVKKCARLETNAGAGPESDPERHVDLVSFRRRPHGVTKPE